jgi:glutamyl-tRNA synthetase
MHLGDLRVALFNYMVSQQQNQQFLVRIEDSDKARIIEGKDTEIMQILEKFALTHDHVMHQSEHLNIHQTLAVKLLEEGKAFICVCTLEELEQSREEAKQNGVAYHYSGKCETLTKQSYHTLKESNTPFVVRVKKPNKESINHDLIKGESTTSPDEIDSFVILDVEGNPTSNFATSCDDMLNNITLVIRGEEHFSNTAKQKYMHTLLGYKGEIMYAHLPILLNSEGQPMSMQNHENSVKWLFEEGYIPDAILNYLILLGSTPPTEVFTLPEALEWFEFSDISNVATKFDLHKLRFLNREHLKRMDNRLLSTLFGFADEEIGKLAKVYLQEASTLKELHAKIEPIFTSKTFEGKWSEGMRVLQAIIKVAPTFKAYDAFIAYLIVESGLEGEQLFEPLRLLLTNAPSGPELSDIYPHIQSYLLEVIS